jgi:hypothetical protein
MSNAKIAWKLWIDDLWFDRDAPERHPPDGFIPAESCSRAKELVIERGLPEFISFDHDLGDGHDSPEFIRWLVNDYVYETHETFVPEYAVHSANPSGRLTIISLMDSWSKVVS